MRSQSQDPRAAAEAVARAALEALDARDWSHAAELVHPEALDAIRRQTISRLRDELRIREEPRQWPRNPNMPEPVAAWFEEEGLKQLAAYDPLREYRVTSIEELEALSPREFFVRHLEAGDPRTKVRVQMEAQGKEPPADAMLDAAFRMRHSVVGSLVEADGTVLVVVRRGLVEMPDLSRGRELAVLTVHRNGDAWKIRPTPEQVDLLNSFVGSIYIDPIADPESNEFARRVVAWPDSTAPEGRAYVVGYSPEKRTVRGLMVELTRPDGEPIRIEIPTSAFGDLLWLLRYWAYTQDPE